VLAPAPADEENVHLTKQGKKILDVEAGFAD
jgi:hypothetical protein